MRLLAVSDSQRRKIVDGIRRIERSYTPDQRGRTPAALWNPGVVRAKVTTAIPTGTFATPSTSGRAQVYHKDATGAWLASGDPVAVLNDHTLTASIAVGKVVKLAWCDGDWYLVAADC